MAIHWGLMMVMLACVCKGVWEAEGSILEFGNLIKELTNKSSFPDYTSYGCYCGLGGRGQPRDATDSCCFDHDCCYGRLSNCSTKTDKYQYTVEDGVVTCGEGSWCEEQICECDKTAALCLRGNLSSYDEKYRFYADIHCKEEAPSC